MPAGKNRQQQAHAPGYGRRHVSIGQVRGSTSQEPVDWRVGTCSQRSIGFRCRNENFRDYLPRNSRIDIGANCGMLGQHLGHCRSIVAGACKRMNILEVARHRSIFYRYIYRQK